MLRFNKFNLSTKPLLNLSFVGVSDTAMVDDVFDGNPSLLDSIAVELDSTKWPLRNWRDLASKLIADGQLLREYEAELHYPSGNPTALLFRYLSRTNDFRHLTVGNLKEELNNMPRRDVVKLLVDANVQGMMMIVGYVIVWLFCSHRTLCLIANGSMGAISNQTLNVLLGLMRYKSG